MDVAEEQTPLQDAVPRTEAERVEAKKLLAAERKKPENGKAFGQPVNSKVDDALKREGVDRAAQFGGTIEGNGARMLIKKCVTIIDEMVEFVLQAPAATRVAGMDEEVRHVGQMHKHLLLSLDGCFSSIQTKQFHLTPEIVEKTKQHRDRFLALERCLCMSTTTKSHWSGCHSVEQQEALEGVGGVGEDCGERNHQDEAKADRRLGCVGHFPTRENIKSKEEVQRKDTRVQAKMGEIEGKRKRGCLEGTEARQAARKARRLEA